MTLGMCPTLAVTTSLINGVGMGMSTLAVLVCSNFIISLLRKFIPDTVRIPAYIVIVASLVTIIQFVLQGFVPELYSSLGIYIPLIVVNCIILGRAEAYASKNKLIPSIFDGIGMGLGFTMALAILGFLRELIGNGTILSDGAKALVKIPEEIYTPASIMILAPGAFIVLAFVIAAMNKIKEKSLRGFKHEKGAIKNKDSKKMLYDMWISYQNATLDSDSTVDCTQYYCNYSIDTTILSIEDRAMDGQYKLHFDHNCKVPEKDVDELFDDVVAFIAQEQKCSISMLQRKFSIGYNRSARIVDELEMRGMVGKQEGAKPRKVYLPAPENQE